MPHGFSSIAPLRKRRRAPLSNPAIMSDDRVPFPYDDLHAAGREHDEYRSALADFHGEYGSPTPDRERLTEHAQRVRGFAALAAPFERWWLDPRVQAFVAELNATGL
ncbi:MAG: hypothetical protein NVSMB19_24550 [Vulcanimicrobiaceae bacterium]